MLLRQHNDSQDPDELRRFVELARSLNVRKYLEIGSRFGDSLYAVIANLEPGALGVAIDLEGDLRLYETSIELRHMGHECIVITGSSQNQLLHQLVASVAPFDLILIDGDHSHAGVSADWWNYAMLGKVIALHDIISLPNPGVAKFWGELLGMYPDRPWQEIITPGSDMGYGIINGGAA